MAKATSSNTAIDLRWSINPPLRLVYVYSTRSKIEYVDAAEMGSTLCGILYGTLFFCLGAGTKPIAIATSKLTRDSVRYSSKPDHT